MALLIEGPIVKDIRTSPYLEVSFRVDEPVDAVLLDWRSVVVRDGGRCESAAAPDEDRKVTLRSAIPYAHLVEFPRPRIRLSLTSSSGELLWRGHFRPVMLQGAANLVPIPEEDFLAYDR